MDNLDLYSRFGQDSCLWRDSGLQLGRNLYACAAGIPKSFEHHVRGTNGLCEKPCGDIFVLLSMLPGTAQPRPDESAQGAQNYSSVRIVVVVDD